MGFVGNGAKDRSGYMVSVDVREDMSRIPTPVHMKQKGDLQRRQFERT